MSLGYFGPYIFTVPAPMYFYLLDHIAAMLYVLRQVHE